jgi:hypothetical protein
LIFQEEAPGLNLREIELTKKVKPIVVSMGIMLQGHYIACNANIFAENNTMFDLYFIHLILSTYYKNRHQCRTKNIQSICSIE